MYHLRLISIKDGPLILSKAKTIKRFNEIQLQKKLLTTALKMTRNGSVLSLANFEIPTSFAYRVAKNMSGNFKIGE